MRIALTWREWLLQLPGDWVSKESLEQAKRLSCTSLCITWVSGALWPRDWFVTVLRYVGQWDSMEEYMCLIPRNSYNGAFYRAVFALHTENYQLAQQVCILSVLNIFLKIDKIKCDPILLLWLRELRIPMHLISVHWQSQRYSGHRADSYGRGELQQSLWGKHSFYISNSQLISLVL